MDTVQEFSDVLYLFPSNILEQIFSYLDVKDLLACSETSVTCYNIHNHKTIWKRLCVERDWLKFDGNYLECRLPTEEKLRRTSPHFTFIDDKCLDRLTSVNHWKVLFMKVTHLSNNWALGKYDIETVCTKTQHKTGIMCLDCSDDYIVHGKENGTVELTYMENNGKTIELQQPNGIEVNNVKIFDQFVYATLTDGLVKRFDLTGALVRTYTGCSELHNFIAISDTIVATVTEILDIIIWNVKTSNLLHRLSVHHDDVEMVLLHKNLLLTSDWDRKMILTDTIRGEVLYEIITAGEIMCGKFDEEIILTGSSESLVELWETVGGVPILSMSGHEAEVYCVTYNKEIIVSGSADSTIRIWDTLGEFQYLLRGHIGVVRCIYLDDMKLVSYGDQTRMIVWDVKKMKKLNVLYRNPYLISSFFVNYKHIITLSPDSRISKFNYW